VFLGLFTFFHRAYKEKVRIRQEAGAAAFESASRGCMEGSTGTETSMASGSGTRTVANTASKKHDGTASTLNFEHGTASASKQATVSWNTAYGPWTRTLKAAESHVYCNERGVDTSSGSWLQWGTDNYRSQ
jgi:hypothetical protein